MSASRGYFAHLFHYIQRRPVVSLCAGCGAYATGYAAATGDLPISFREKTPVLNTSTFTPYTLIAKHQISHSSSIFILRPPSSDHAVQQLKDVWTSSTNLWSVQAKQPQLQIGREYTPLPPTHVLSSSQISLLREDGGDAADADIHLLIRREKNGEMTTYLDTLPLEATIHLRGPYQDVKIPENVDEILFLAGGTGISPALQVAHIMSKRNGAKVHILWANRRRDECVGAPLESSSGSHSGLFGNLHNLWRRSSNPATTTTTTTAPSNTVSEEKGLVVKILQEMKSRVPPGQFEIQYFVDEEDSFIRSREVKRILSSKPGSDNSVGAKLIVVSGPEGFVDYWAGRKRLEEGKERQGPLGGRLGQMELNGWKVWKL
jgi:Oxidoreductase FAD-binding domain